MKLQSLVPFALFAFATAASADGFYGLGEVTRSSTSLDRAHFDSSLTAHGATGLSSNDSGNGTQWRLQGGYQFNPYVSLEAGYIDFGKAKYTATYAGGSAQGSLKAGGVDLAALLSLPVNDSLSVFAKGGVVAAKVDSKLVAGAPAAAASGSDSEHIVRPMVGLGASYKLSEQVALRADYDHISNLGRSDRTGKMDANLVSVGIAYDF